MWYVFLVGMVKFEPWVTCCCSILEHTKTKKGIQHRKLARERALVEWVHLARVHLAWVHLGTVRYHQSGAEPHRVLQVVGRPACIASLF